ncbi:MAG: hypothetical protein DRQ89_12320 [Epsilonproteobacteria bacterium]|nr:MAG: hypothetical protein DRQ89_12320 [Campylobacterota bacterium]
MVQAVGAHSSYDEPIATGGNREDLSDVLFDVSPTETPGITAIKKGKATATAHDWLTDELEDPGNNAHIEGDDAAPVDAAPRVRLSNYCQIFKKHAVVTGTQEKVLKGGGIKSEMAYQVARRMKAIKRDAETAVFGGISSKVAGDDATPRKLGCFRSYMAGTSFNHSGDGVPPTGNGIDLGGDGTDRDFTESVMKDALAQLWDQSGGNENVLALMGKNHRGWFSAFDSSNTRYVTTDDRKLVASIDVYDGDFHTVTAAPDRFTDTDSVLLLDSEYASLNDLRPLFTKDLAVLGDSTRKELVWETTLEVCNPLAHVMIAALNDTPYVAP